MGHIVYIGMVALFAAFTLAPLFIGSEGRDDR